MHPKERVVYFGSSFRSFSPWVVRKHGGRIRTEESCTYHGDQEAEQKAKGGAGEGCISLVIVCV